MGEYVRPMTYSFLHTNYKRGDNLPGHSGCGSSLKDLVHCVHTFDKDLELPDSFNADNRRDISQKPGQKDLENSDLSLNAKKRNT